MADLCSRKIVCVPIGNGSISQGQGSATILFAATTLAVLYSAANILVANAPHLRAMDFADA